MHALPPQLDSGAQLHPPAETQVVQMPRADILLSALDVPTFVVDDEDNEVGRAQPTTEQYASDAVRAFTVR